MPTPCTPPQDTSQTLDFHPRIENHDLIPKREGIHVFHGSDLDLSTITNLDDKTFEILNPSQLESNERIKNENVERKIIKAWTKYMESTYILEELADFENTTLNFYSVISFIHSLNIEDIHLETTEEMSFDLHVKFDPNRKLIIDFYPGLIEDNSTDTFIVSYINNVLVSELKFNKFKDLSDHLDKFVV